MRAVDQGNTAFEIPFGDRTHLFVRVGGLGGEVGHTRLLLRPFTILPKAYCLQEFVHAYITRALVVHLANGEALHGTPWKAAHDVAETFASLVAMHAQRMRIDDQAGLAANDGVRGRPRRAGDEGAILLEHRDGGVFLE